MMARSRRFAPIAVVSLVALLALAGCQAIPHAEPVARPVPAPAPPPPPPPAADTGQSWEEASVAPGDWSYDQSGVESVARFGPTGAAPLVSLRCVKASRRIILQGAGLGSGTALTIRTSYGALQWAADAPAGITGLSVTRAASDPGFDWIAYSRGRISLETAGAPRLIVPVWAELVRIIEDCRG